ncbi:hypothetical protein Tco_1541798 [Tanacetum coccineum]
MDLLSDVAFLEAAQLKKVLKKSNQDTHMFYVSGSDDGVGSQPKVPDELQDKTIGTNKGTGIIPGVPDVPKDQPESENESWGDSGDDDYSNDKDNDDDSGDDGNNVCGIIEGDEYVSIINLRLLYQTTNQVYTTTTLLNNIKQSISPQYNIQHKHRCNANIDIER